MATRRKLDQMANLFMHGFVETIINDDARLNGFIERIEQNISEVLVSIGTRFFRPANIDVLLNTSNHTASVNTISYKIIFYTRVHEIKPEIYLAMYIKGEEDGEDEYYLVNLIDKMLARTDEDIYTSAQKNIPKLDDAEALESPPVQDDAVRFSENKIELFMSNDISMLGVINPVLETFESMDFSSYLRNTYMPIAKEELSGTLNNLFVHGHIDHSFSIVHFDILPIMYRFSIVYKEDDDITLDNRGGIVPIKIDAKQQQITFEIDVPVTYAYEVIPV